MPLTFERQTPVPARRKGHHILCGVRDCGEEFGKVLDYGVQISRGGRRDWYPWDKSSA